MTTALTKPSLDNVEFIAEDLQGHAEQLARYEAAGLESKDAFMLEAHAARILTVAKKGVLQIGQELLEARERAKHGTWGTFLQRVQLSDKTALNYMQAYEHFADKPDVAALLPASALYLLAAPNADPEVVEGIVEEVRSGAPAPKVEEVKQRLAAHRPTPAEWDQASRRAAALGMRITLHDDGDVAFTDAGNGGLIKQYAGWKVALVYLDERETEKRRAATGPAYTPPTKPTPVLTPLRQQSAGEHEGSPRQADDTEEIAAAAPPRPAPPPLVMTPLAPTAPATAPAADRKLLVSKRALLASALAMLDTELAASEGPTIVVRQEDAEQAARMFLDNPALSAAAAMLAFSARVEE